MTKIKNKKNSDTPAVVPGSKDLAPQLTNNQRIFCDEYLIDRNGARAYKAAYKSCKKDSTARANACALLTNTNISNYIDARLKTLSDKAGVKAERVLKEEARIALSDIRLLFDDNIPIAPSDLPEDVARALSSIKINKRNNTGSDGIEKNGTTVEYRFWDKGAALGRLEKLLGMHTKKVDLNIKNETEVTPFETVRRLAFILAKKTHEMDNEK
jgi:phage terminase small subunit